MSTHAPCAVCGTPAGVETLAEAGWAAADTARALSRRRPGWRRADGACPACVQQALLTLLLERGEHALGRVIQEVWPLDAEAAFGALPTPLRMRADPRFTGRGVTVAVVDAAFHAHPDLTLPVNRIRAWVDAGADPREARFFDALDDPRWPGCDAGEPSQWHGLMTSATLAGNGWMSHGLYRGMAPDAELVLVQARDAGGDVTAEGIASALGWIDEHRDSLGISVVNVSLGAGAGSDAARTAVEAAVARLVARGVTVVVAAGNDGERRLVPPASAPAALTVGGLDDRNVFDAAHRALWHGSHGDGKPELVAPSAWVAAPVLPGSAVAAEARSLFARRAAGDAGAEPRIAALRLVTPHYQHVEGTSFASPIVAGAVACLAEAVGALEPRRARAVLLAACHAVPGAPPERQGAGALDAGKAIALALAGWRASPEVAHDGVRFALHDRRARRVEVVGSWDDWRRPGLVADRVGEGVWEARAATVPPGRHAYKFVVDDATWLPDPHNAARAADGLGGWNSVLDVPAPSEAAA